MITCDFFGGLGNNLFQLALVYSIHKKYGVEMVIPSRSGRGNIHEFGQEPNLELSRLFENKFTYDDSLNLIKYIHPDVDPSKTDFTYIEVPLYDNACYHGYFQSERYFQGVDISKEFILKRENVEYLKHKHSGTFQKKVIGLHCRLGGDRVLPSMQHYHKNVSIEYYQKALELSNYSPDTHNILVFTDRIKEGKEMLEILDLPLIFIEGENNVMDFTLMSLCNTNIVGNSTFSWWAAYMNQNSDKRIIVPATEWFGPGYAHFKTTDTFPTSWIKL